MTPLLRAVGIFFKTWFWPQPAHDAIVRQEQEALLTASADPPDTVKEIEPTAAATPQMPRPADLDPVNKDLDAVDFSHLVKPPEGSEERLSRGSATVDEPPPAPADKTPDDEIKTAADQPTE